jgi:polyribonucleotide nucleotidyltransferase
VEILPGTEGLLHISEIAEYHVRDVRDELKEGDEIEVKVLQVDDGRVRLSRKAILREQRIKEGKPEPSPRPREREGDRDRGGDRDRSRDYRDNRGSRDGRRPPRRPSSGGRYDSSRGRGGGRGRR